METKLPTKVYLKNGSCIDAISAEEKENGYSISIKGGVIILPKVDVDKIVSASSDEIALYKLKESFLNQAASANQKELNDFLKQNNIVNVTFKGNIYTLTEKQAKELKDEEMAGGTYLLGLDYVLYSRATVRRVEYCLKNKTGLSVEKISLILNGKIRMGMNKEESVASWGEPKDINRTVTSLSIHEQWVYDHNNYLYFEDGVLTSWQD